MIRNFIIILLVTAAFNSVAVAENYSVPEMKIVVETLEIDKLQISLDKNLNGYLLGKQKKKLIISPQTKAYKKDIEVPLIKALEQKNKYVEASYDFKTGQVVRINW